VQTPARDSWVSHVHGPYPYPVIRRRRSNRSSLEGFGTPPRVNRLDSLARGSGDLADSERRAASDGSPRICPPTSSNRDVHPARGEAWLTLVSRGAEEQASRVWGDARFRSTSH
jgi:hypothetical protein